MSQAGNEVSNAMRIYLVADAAIAALVGGVGSERIYAEEWPAELDTWPAIRVESQVATTRIETPALGVETMQIKVVGNPYGEGRADHSQIVRTLANLIRARVTRTPILGQYPILGCTNLSVLPGETDPDTAQPVQRVLATVLAAHEQEAVIP